MARANLVGVSEPNTLGLDDDLDSVELLIAIERALDVKISDQEASTVATMGDLHQIVVSKLKGTGGDKCRTSMAFYRARRALQAVTGRNDIRPVTPLSDLGGGSPRSLFAEAQKHCDLRLAPLSGTNMGAIGALLILAALVGAPILLIAHINGWLILALAVGFIASGMALIRLDPLSFGRELQTVGDLARIMVSDNYGALIRLGGRSDADAVWAALVELAARGSESLRAEQIKPGTIILQSQFQKAQARA